MWKTWRQFQVTRNVIHKSSSLLTFLSENDECSDQLIVLQHGDSETSPYAPEVGYSRLMGKDEAGIVSRLTALRRELIDPTIAAHNGRIVKLMGDGALVEFASAVDAVTCAIEIQRQLREAEARGTNGDPIRFRIGINVGDILIDGEDILGDGVNVAARVEGIAEPGGISISEKPSIAVLPFDNMSDAAAVTTKPPVIAKVRSNKLALGPPRRILR